MRKAGGDGGRVGVWLLTFLSLGCLLEIQVEVLGRKLNMKTQLWEVVQAKDVSLRVIKCILFVFR